MPEPQHPEFLTIAQDLFPSLLKANDPEAAEAAMNSLDGAGQDEVDFILAKVGILQLLGQAELLKALQGIGTQLEALTSVVKDADGDISKIATFIDEVKAKVDEELKAQGQTQAATGRTATATPQDATSVAPGPEDPTPQAPEATPEAITPEANTPEAITPEIFVPIEGHEVKDEGKATTPQGESQ